MGTGQQSLSLLWLHLSCPINDFSFGSACLKPASFDIGVGLEQLEPALFIACPVVKELNSDQREAAVPFINRLWRYWSRLDSRYSRALYAAGDDWAYRAQCVLALSQSTAVLI